MQFPGLEPVFHASERQSLLSTYPGLRSLLDADSGLTPVALKSKEIIQLIKCFIIFIFLNKKVKKYSANS